MLDVRERLAGHLYQGALDLDPDTVVALRIGAGDALTWEIDDGVLSISIIGALLFTYDLASFTVQQLADALVEDGVAIKYLNQDVLHLSAAALVSGSGDERQSNGDSLRLFRSSLWAVLDAYGVEVRTAEKNVAEAVKQLYIGSAERDFLEYWGEFFAVARFDGESDASYRAKIIAEVIRPRGGPIAIMQAVKALTGFDVVLREPWREIFTLDFSALSDRHHFQDGNFFTWNVFQPIYHQNLSPAERERVLAVIDKYRPACSLVVAATAQPAAGFARGAFLSSLQSKIVAVYNFGVMHYRPGVLSSSMALSDNFRDIGSVFAWRQYGNLVLQISVSHAFGIFESPKGWEDVQWGRYGWMFGSPGHFGITQHHVP